MNTPETVLIVDDEAMIRTLIRNVLERSGFSVLDASDADDAIAVFRRHQAAINLVILDLIMPGKSGIEVARSFLELHPGLAILFISGFSNAKLPDEHAFLAKPFSPRQLTEKAKELIHRVAA